MSLSHQKVKSVGKVMTVRGPRLEALIAETLKTCSDLVGSTLGPGGLSVIIERQESGLPPIVTKDGVTVYKALGFQDPTQQVLMEAMREASVRTAAEAGDGPQPLWSKILTPNGFISMGEAKEGMEICGTNGSVQRIEGVFPKGQKEIVKVTFSNKQVVECCPDHVWTTTHLWMGLGNTVTLTTRQMSEDTGFAKYFVKVEDPNVIAGIAFVSVSSIEFTGKFTEMQCIKVSNSDHLYVTDGFIVTHNTTSATILSESLRTGLAAVTKANPHLSAQIITRNLQKLFASHVEPFLKSQSLPCDMAKNRDRLYNVARISANGDGDLAKAVMHCFDLVGDEGNVTITEASGQSEYLVEKVEGFPIPMGYEESCGIFYPEFINDPATQQSVLKKPLWILYHGILNDFNEIFIIAQQVAEAASQGKCSPNIVVVSTGFSDSFKAQCAASFKTQGAIRIFPLLAPRSIHKTGQLDFLEDIAALTGAKIFNPLNAPLEGFGALSDIGGLEGPTLFEAGRFRATLIGYGDEVLVLERVDAIEKQLQKSELSELDRSFLKERKAKLTSGIARLIVRGSSNGEVKEKRDRAEDAVCAVRSAIKHGALVGGGKTWLKLADFLQNSAEITGIQRLVVEQVLVPAVKAPVYRLYSNAGFSEPETLEIVNKMRQSGVFDLAAGSWLDDSDESLLDSYSAVKESLKNGISVAISGGTCGGVVVFGRDPELERQEANEAMEYMKSANYSEANSRP